MDFVASTWTSGVGMASPSQVVAGTLDRSRKGDRLNAPRPVDKAGVTVATGDSRFLLRLHPRSNVTVIEKGLGSPTMNVGRPSYKPARSIREPGSGADRIPARLPEASPERKKLPDGCDPSFSPVAAPALSHITGRCIA
jgi:hypothetical protein